jgi:hypothetical protein
VGEYVAENELETEVKRGCVKLDPFIANFVGDIKPGQLEVKKEYIYKNLEVNLIKCHVVSVLDE